MRGAHRDVWCSKIQRLIEAELFAAERRRPALSGRALLCAAVYAREIQGITATHKLKNARNRAPVPPFRREAPLSVSKEGKGSQEGTGNHWCPVPFCLRRQTAAFSPVNTGSPRRRAAAMHTPCHGEHPPSKEGVFRLQRRTAVPAEGIPSADGQKGDGKNSELTLAEKGELFYNKINTWEDFL